jgi:hypothetical protein
MPQSLAARFWLSLEFLILFVLGPIALTLWATHYEIYVALWLSSLYALICLRRAPDFSWRVLWKGEAWPRAARKKALLRFLILAPVLTALTLILVPNRFFQFPLERPVLWLVVMVLYPLLSVIPQELLFRSFFMKRYRTLFPRAQIMIGLSGLAFGFSHLPLDNLVGPSLAALGGMIFAASHAEHRSLKWATIEHALYGCFVFTVGLGWYFYIGNWRP